MDILEQSKANVSPKPTKIRQYGVIVNHVVLFIVFYLQKDWLECVVIAANATASKQICASVFKFVTEFLFFTHIRS